MSMRLTENVQCAKVQLSNHKIYLGNINIFEKWRYINLIDMSYRYTEHPYLVIRFMKPIFTWIAREDDDLDVDLIKNQMTKSSNY